MTQQKIARKRVRFTFALLIGIIVLGIVAACGGTPTQPEEVGVSGETLLEERCSTCHGTDRVTQASKTQEEWDQTVTNMVEKGAELTAEEQEVLVAYLAETYGP
jgi:mono/diheme cytochrome c family protein